MLNDDETDADTWNDPVILKSDEFLEKLPGRVQIESNSIVADIDDVFIGIRPYSDFDDRFRTFVCELK